MFKKLTLFIKNLFTSGYTVDDEIVADKSYSDVAATPASKIRKQLDKIEQPIPVKNISVNFNNEHIKKVNREAIENKIKKNIFFIDNLMGKMEGIEEYISYYNKLDDLRTQSQNSLRLLFRIKEEAPYYYNTVKAIMQHTKVISGLLITK